MNKYMPVVLIGLGVVVGISLGFVEYAPLILLGLGAIALTTIVLGAVLIGMRMQVASIADVAKAIADTQVSNDKYDIQQMRMFMEVLKQLNQQKEIGHTDVIESTARELPAIIEDDSIKWE